MSKYISSFTTIKFTIKAILLLSTSLLPAIHNLMHVTTIHKIIINTIMIIKINSIPYGDR